MKVGKIGTPHNKAYLASLRPNPPSVDFRYARDVIVNAPKE
jgi:hypothetical protein